MNIYILLVLASFFLLSVLAGVAMLVVRPRYRHGYIPSPDSKVTPLGEYRLRRVRFNVPPEDGMKRARERCYVKKVEDEA